MFPTHCVAGTSGSEIIEALAPEKGDKIIRKRRYSSFFWYRFRFIFKGK